MHDETPARFRLRLIAGVALLVGIAFIQAPGFMVADTKFDLAVTPAEFLARALHLWDPTASFGQVQDQSYGYLWPTGPFFVVGNLLGIPAWIIQRLWYGLVLSAAFVGTAKVTRALGVRSDLAVIVAGFAYALSPALLTKIGPISSEAWTIAMAPWVLLPLVLGSRAGTSPRRAGILAGVAVAIAGGINAVATAAVLPLGVVWLLTRTGGRRRWSLFGWWVLATVLGTLWWAGPLLLLGAYSPPFLDFIESADTTTFANNVADALRGTTHWVPYLDGSWQAGRELLTTGFLALDFAVVIGLGLIGIAHRGQPHRVFLISSVLVGLVLTSLGHQGAVSGWFAGSINDSLDAALAPIRNLHKFDPIIRLPLIIGFAWAVDVAVHARHRVEARFANRTVQWRPGAAVAGLACLVVFAGALPAWAGRMAPTSPVLSTPGYWSQAVDWVDQQDRGVALLLPGSSFGHYLWGSPDDEPMQYLDADSWAVRGAVPLAPAGNIRMLNAIEERLAQGEPSAGLARYLRRAGVGLLVVRNDLALSVEAPADALVRQAITGSPGLRLVQSFGPDVGGDPVVVTEQGRLLPDGGWQRHRPALEIYAVDGADASRSVSTSAAPVVVGGPEDLLDLTDAGLIGDQPTVLASDLDTGANSEHSQEIPTGPVLLTDGMLDREQTFGRVHDAASAVRSPGDVRRTGNRVQGYEITDDRWRTTTRLTGAESVTASSSMSDANAYGGAVPGDLPLAALDGDPATAWVSGVGVGGTPWWRLELGRQIPASTVRITASDRTALPAAEVQLRARTDGGTGPWTSVKPGSSTTLELPAGTTDWLQVEGLEGEQIALAEVAVDGVAVRRQLVLPTLDADLGDPDAILLRALTDARTGCVEIRATVSCLAERARPSEEPAGFERVLSLPAASTWQGDLLVRARPGAALEELLTQDYLTGASASSTGVPDARASVIAALDGQNGTTWIADADDPAPSIDMHWLEARPITAITAKINATAPASAPTELTLTWPGGSRIVRLDASGFVKLTTPIVTDQLVITVSEARTAVWSDEAGAWHDLPVGISRLRLRGLPGRLLAPSEQVRDWGCGSGPTVSVGTRRVQTRLVAAPADLAAMKAVPASLCGPVDLHPGTQTVAVDATDAVVPVRLLLQRSDAAAVPSTAGTITRTDADKVTRTLSDFGTGVAIADQRENTNAGWRATQAGAGATPVTLDGWRQGWVSEGEDPITVRYAPDPTYRLVLLGGLVGLGLVWLAALRRRWGGESIAGLTERPSRAGLIVSALVAAGLMTGWVGVALVGVAMAGAALTARHRADEPAFAVIGTLIGAVGLGYALRPWLSSTGWAGDWGWPSYLTVAALGVTVGAVLWRRPKRVKGRSTA